MQQCCGAAVLQFVSAAVRQGCGSAVVPQNVMSGILAFLGATLGGWIGWWLGEWIGLMTAFFLSIIGSGVGLYAGRRLFQWMSD